MSRYGYGTVRRLTYKTSSWAPVALRLPSINLISVCLPVVHVCPYTNSTPGTRVLRSRTPSSRGVRTQCLLSTKWSGSCDKSAEKTPPKVSVCPPRTVTMTNSDWAPGDENTDDKPWMMFMVWAKFPSSGRLMMASTVQMAWFRQ